MIAIATPDKSVYEGLRTHLRMSSDERAMLARGHGWVMVCAQAADARAFLDEVTDVSGAEAIIFATVGAALSNDHETGDVVLPNVILAAEARDGQELPPIFLDLYPEQEDLLYEDVFGLSVWGIALDIAVADTIDDEAMIELRSRSEADAAVPGIYALTATHRVAGYESVFVPVVAVERSGSKSGVDPVESLARTIEFLRDSFA